MFLHVYRWWTKWGVWLAVRVSSGEAAIKPFFEMVYYDSYFTIYIDWFKYPRQGSGHYTNFKLKYMVNV